MRFQLSQLLSFIVWALKQFSGCVQKIDALAVLQPIHTIFLLLYNGPGDMMGSEFSWHPTADINLYCAGNAPCMCLPIGTQILVGLAEASFSLDGQAMRVILSHLPTRRKP
jgi:hypothetical protein